MPHLVIESPEKLHLLSLLVRERLCSALATVEGRNLAGRLQGRIGLVAGGMETRLVLDGHSIRLDQNTRDRPQARAAGTLASFLAICHGKIRFSDVLRGQLRVAGNLLLLRRFFPLLSMGIQDEQE